MTDVKNKCEGCFYDFAWKDWCPCDGCIRVKKEGKDCYRPTPLPAKTKEE